MNKVQIREIRLAWSFFDRKTAYGCASRGEPYDSQVCQDAWDLYISIITKYDILPPPTPLGLTNHS